MERKPRLLDMYCGAGGAAVGYHRAGFEVVGVDIAPQKHYPFTFVKGDALAYALAHGYEFDAVHASPPCQAHTGLKALYQGTDYAERHVDLIPHTRFVLQALGLPYIIENVAGAKKALRNPVMLCGADFGLKVYRHRFFESSFTLHVPEHVPHGDRTPGAGRGTSPKGFVTVTGTGGQMKGADYGGLTFRQYAAKAMQIDWYMTRQEQSESIPPAFTEFLGRQLIAHIQGEGAPVQLRMWA